METDMQNFLKVIRAKPELPQKYEAQRKKVGFNARDKYIVHEVNGFTFCLNYRMWADYRAVTSGAISHRLRRGYPTAQVLGFEKLVRKKK